MERFGRQHESWENILLRWRRLASETRATANLCQHQFRVDKSLSVRGESIDAYLRDDLFLAVHTKETTHKDVSNARETVTFRISLRET